MVLQVKFYDGIGSIVNCDTKASQTDVAKKLKKLAIPHTLSEKENFGYGCKYRVYSKDDLSTLNLY